MGSELIGETVECRMDNWGATKTIELESTKMKCMVIALRIAELVEKYDIDLSVVWRRRNT